jgi:glycosyltransferase involved in cell wall biosynthesis
LQSLLALRREQNLDDSAHFLYELDVSAAGQGLKIPDAVVADLYTLADALIFPSWGEGFGIPVLEAGLARLPVFCADIPTLRESGGGLAHFFDPNADPSAVATLILDVIESDQPGLLRRRVRQRYTWSQIFRDRIMPLLEGL